MAGEKEFIADFCKARRFTRFQTKRNLAAPLDVLDVTTIAPLGCNLIAGHQGTEAGVILSTVDHRTGGYGSAILTSADPESVFNPGPATNVDATPTLQLTGAATLPFPTTNVSSTIDYNLAGRLWWAEVDDVETYGENQRNALTFGFGGDYGPTKTLHLPTGKEFTHSFGRLAYHVYTNQVLMPRLNVPLTPLGLGYVPSHSRYEWPAGVPGVGGIATETSFAGEVWSFGVFFYQVHPALVGFNGEEVSDYILNPLQPHVVQNDIFDRKYCYVDLETLTWPAYGGSVARAYTIPGGLRPQSVIYSQSANSPGWTLTINGTPIGLGGGSAVLPTPQLIPFPPSSVGGSATPCDAATEADLGLDTTLFTFVATGFAKVLTVGPLLFSGLAGPRQYEFIVSFLHVPPP
jgi:hypothetical protein